MAHIRVAPEVAGLALDATLLVRLVGRAELALKAPVRAEGYEARGLLAPIAAQDLLHRGFQVVVPQPANRPAPLTSAPRAMPATP
jgi:hypothetical protein